MTNLFTERALKSKHSSRELSGPVTLLTPPLKATLALALLIAFGGTAWAFLARIPLNVNARGVLLPVSTLTTFSSKTDGTAYHFYNKNLEEWESLAYRYSTSPSSLSRKSIVRLANLLINESESDALSTSPDQNYASTFLSNLESSLIDTKLPKGKLLLWIQEGGSRSKLNSALSKFNKAIQQLNLKSKNIRSQQSILRKEYDQRSDYLQRMQELESKGYVTRTSILDQTADVDQLLSKLYDNKNDLITLESNVEESYNEVRSVLSDIIENQLVFSRGSSYLVEVIPNHGQLISKGDNLVRLSSDPLNSPVLVPLFLGGDVSSQVSAGMDAIATPDGYKRSEVGGIKGTVKSVTRLPAGVDGIASLVGDKTVAEDIVKSYSSPTLAVLALDRNLSSPNFNSGGYLWTSKEDLPFPPKPGDLLDVQITTRRVVPAQLVIPSLKRFFGLTPPEAQSNSSV